MTEEKDKSIEELFSELWKMVKRNLKPKPNFPLLTGKRPDKNTRAGYLYTGKKKEK